MKNPFTKIDEAVGKGFSFNIGRHGFDLWFILLPLTWTISLDEGVVLYLSCPWVLLAIY